MPDLSAAAAPASVFARADAAPASVPACCAHAPAAPSGSRRRRLWELASHAHCPVVGVCLPLATVRRLAQKVCDLPPDVDDYLLHNAAVGECRKRSPLAEALQRELDRRAAIALKLAAGHKTVEDLEAWWQAASRGEDIGGALWATLTHPRCDAVLEEQVLQQVHMLQHQLGACERVDRARLHALERRARELADELAAARERAAQAAEEHAQAVARLQGELLRARADLLGRDTTLAALAEQLAALEAAAPGLKSRVALTHELQAQAQRIRDLERIATRLRDEAVRGRGADEGVEGARPQPAPPATPAAPVLAQRAVLCVGGRTASVPVYRRLVEGVGGRFLHHDGGEQDNPAALEPSLAAADLVICQTGCISHDAYWRVKDHCKRTGKRCVFVENPSRSGLERALSSLGEAA